MDALVAEKQTPLEYQEQRVRGEEVLRWLTYVGNDERKLAIVLALDQADGSLGKSGLYRYMGDLAGKDGIPGDLTAPFHFCEQSLSQVDVVEVTTTVVMRFGTTPEIAPAFEITHSPTEREFGVAFAGSLLSWSKRHPKLSLSILGQSSSKNDNPAPLVRFWSLYDLATSPDSPKSPSIVHIAQHLALADSTRGGTADRLRQLGLVRKENSFEENKRQFRIIQPEYIIGPRKRAFERLTPETQMLFGAFGKAFKEKPVWELDSFMNLVAEMYPDATPEQLKKTRTSMHQVFVPGTYHYKGVVEPYGDRQYDANSKVELLPEATAAIQELITIIDGFYSGDLALIEAGRTQANKIISNRKSVAKLYKKGYDNSNLANEDDQFEERLMDIVRAVREGITSRLARDIYVERTGRKVSTRTVQNRLGKLMTRGEIELQVAPTSRVNKQPVHLYRAASREA